jgi:hypothetical protein
VEGIEGAKRELVKEEPEVDDIGEGVPLQELEEAIRLAEQVYQYLLADEKAKYAAPDQAKLLEILRSWLP